MLMIAESGAFDDSAIIDIGGGSSVLIDHLLDADFSDVTVLDISERALIGEQGAARCACRGGALDHQRCARLDSGAHL